MRPIVSWLSEEALAGIYSADYWNDIEREKKKEWWIEDGNYERCRRYLESTKLMLEYQQAEAYVREMPGNGLRILDLAAGIGWTSALLSRLDKVAEVHAVEISRHRLERLFPHAMTMFSGHGEKVHRYLGSFYDVQLPEHSMDAVFLSQAFHHADRPLQLLTECDRVLKPGGRILLIGEPHVPPLSVARRFVGTLLRERRVLTHFHELFPTDRDSGDHYYRLSEYYFMFRVAGYKPKHSLLASGNLAYVADKGAHV
jgi:ubiquinone/menaquinone biosynthesis C-methylase UbiE